MKQALQQIVKLLQFTGKDATFTIYANGDCAIRVAHQDSGRISIHEVLIRLDSLDDRLVEAAANFDDERSVPTRP